jgi:hypothetical protein
MYISCMIIIVGKCILLTFILFYSKHFSISIAPVQGRGGSLVSDKDILFDTLHFINIFYDAGTVNSTSDYTLSTALISRGIHFNIELQVYSVTCC